MICGIVDAMCDKNEIHEILVIYQFIIKNVSKDIFVTNISYDILVIIISYEIISNLKNYVKSKMLIFYLYRVHIWVAQCHKLK